MSDLELESVYCDVGDFATMSPDLVLGRQSWVKVVGDEGEEWDITHDGKRWVEDVDGEPRPCDFADLQGQGFYWYAPPSGEEVARKVREELARRGGA